MTLSHFLKLTAVPFIIGAFFLVGATSVFAAPFTCQFSCLRRVPQRLACCNRPGGVCGPIGTVTSPTESQLREMVGRGSGLLVTTGGYTVDPIYYTLVPHTTRIDSTEGASCTNDCTSACVSTCGPLASSGEPSGEGTRCMGTTIVPSYVRTTPRADCQSVIGGGAISSDLLTVRSGPAPHCSAVDTSTDTPIGGTASGQACNPPPIPENAPSKKCVFYCMEPGTGTSGTGLSSLETGETSTGARCINVNVTRHVGTRACTDGGVCACVDECKSVCGSEGGKSRCYIGPNNPDQILACSGAGNIGQAQAPICAPDNTPQGTSATLTNPLGTTDIGELIARFIRALSGIAGSMALLMFVVGGVMWMTAEGGERVKTAQEIIKNASIGLILIFFAYSLVSLFLSVLGL